MNKKKIDYALPFKKLYYAHHNEDADMYCRAKEEITINKAFSQIRSLAALFKIKKEVTTAIKNNTVSALYEKWSKEIKISQTPKTYRFTIKSDQRVFQCRLLPEELHVVQERKKYYLSSVEVPTDGIVPSAYEPIDIDARNINEIWEVKSGPEIKERES